MGPVRALFDSNILIRFLNEKRHSVLDDLFAGSPRLDISRVTWIEVMTGSRGDDARVLRSFLDGFQVHEITPEIAERVVHLRRATRLKLPDAIIYATALETGRTLVTLNTRDFPPGTEAVFTPPAD